MENLTPKPPITIEVSLRFTQRVFDIFRDGMWKYYGKMTSTNTYTFNDQFGVMFYDVIAKECGENEITISFN